MTGGSWLIASGVAAVVGAFVLLDVANRARSTERNPMFVALAGFTLGFAGLLVTAVGVQAAQEPPPDDCETGLRSGSDCPDTGD